MASLHNKSKMSLAEKLKIVDKTIESINSQAKKVVCGRIGKDKEIQEKLTRKFVPTPSLGLNEICGGGFPKGCMSLIVGKEDSGKTGTVLETIAYNQKRDPNFIGAFLESENSLNYDDIIKTYKIDPDRFIYIEHERTGAGETALDRCESIIGTGAVDLLCVNSLKCIVPSEDFEKEFGSASIGIQARMNSKMIRKFTALLAETETAFVVITHLSVDIGKMFGDKNVITGGNAIRYGSMLTLNFSKHSIQATDPISKEEGLKVGVSVSKNHCVQGKNPYLKTEFFVIFGEGIEQYLQTLDLAIEKGILVKAGAWIKGFDENGDIETFQDKQINFQGKNSYREFCKNNPEWFEILKSKVDGTYSQNMTEEEIKETGFENDKSIDDMEDPIEEVNNKKKK